MESVNNSCDRAVNTYCCLYWVNALIRHYLTTGRKYVLIKKYALNKHVDLLTRLYSIVLYIDHYVVQILTNGLCYSHTSCHSPYTAYRQVALLDYCLYAGELASIILLMINLLHRASYIALLYKKLRGSGFKDNSQQQSRGFGGILFHHLTYFLGQIVVNGLTPISHFSHPGNHISHLFYAHLAKKIGEPGAGRGSTLTNAMQHKSGYIRGLE